MKLLRHGPPGAEKPGLLDREGIVRDLSGIVLDIDGAALSPRSLMRLAGLDPAALPAVAPGTRLGSCVARPGKFSVSVSTMPTTRARPARRPRPSLSCS